MAYRAKNANFRKIGLDTFFVENLSVWPRENLQKRAPLRNTLFQFDKEINNTCPDTLQNTSILALWQKLRAQVNYFHFWSSNRLFDQLDIM